MKLQQIYNATYNYFAEEDVWPQLIPYNPEWKEYLDQDIKKVYEKGKKDGTKRKQKNNKIKKLSKQLC